MKTIDLENHFATEAWLDALKANKGYPTYDDEKGIGFAADAWMPLRVKPKLLDMDDYRLGLMDEAGVDYAVLSLAAPGVEQLEIEEGKRLARETNDALAAAMKRHPDRFGGFAALAPRTPSGRRKSWSGASKSWASPAGTRTPTSAIRTSTKSSTGLSWPRWRSWACPSIFIPPCP